MTENLATTFLKDRERYEEDFEPEKEYEEDFEASPEDSEEDEPASLHDHAPQPSDHVWTLLKGSNLTARETV